MLQPDDVGALLYHILPQLPEVESAILAALKRKVQRKQQPSGDGPAARGHSW
jgi:hypothetical protein